MDTALKHRLTGAVILVLLAVLLLPELLTGSGQAKGARGLTAAPADTAERSLNIDLTAGAANPLVVSPPVASEPTPVPAAELKLPVPPETVESSPQPQPQPQPQSAAPAAVAPPVAAPAATAPSAAAPSVSPSAPAAPPPAASAPAASSSATGQYYVQLGVFVNRASATNLANKLKAAKFPVKVDEISRDNKILHRVRVGPAADREAANALLQRLAAAGHKGSVVK